MNLPQYAEIHVVSDLHMGGVGRDAQIFRETDRLAKFIAWVSRQQSGEAVALVLNGDIVDTLAEEVGGYVAIDNAVTVVARIMGDPSFCAVWTALAAFVRVPRRTLVFVVGNHDLEMAFPTVQRFIVSQLAGDDLAARARIEFATVGAGFTCLVGTARVFCTHGNEVDSWNYVRYEDLSKAARRLNCGLALDPSDWEPNAGTKLVKDVMNEVKRTYAWIDLLKPETQAALGVLLVLDPRQAKKVARLPIIVGKLARGAMEHDRRLSAEGFVSPAVTKPAPADFDQLLGPRAAQGLRLGGSGVPTRGADEMLLLAEQHFETPRHGGPLGDETLGLPQLLWDRLTGWIHSVGKDEALRRALLDWLAEDKTFDFTTRDATFKDVTASVGASIHFVVTGHTHLERAIDMGGDRYYFNSGTWIRLLRLTEAMLESTTSFRPVFDVLVNGTMNALDAASFGAPFVLDRTTAVRIKSEDRGVVGTLFHVTGGDAMVEPAHEFVRR